MKTIKTTGINFFKCGVWGWCLEVMFTALGSAVRRDWRLMGKTSLLMFPIYGMGAFLSPIGKKLGFGYLGRGSLYMFLIFVGEYFSGRWLTAKGICPWNYSGKPANVQGVIRLDFAPLWFGTGLLFEQITKKKGR